MNLSDLINNDINERQADAIASASIKGAKVTPAGVLQIPAGNAIDGVLDLSVGSIVEAEAGSPSALRPDNYPTIRQITIYADLLNMSELGRKSGMKKNALRRKIERGTELTITESRAIGAVLGEAGLVLEKK